MTGFKYKGVDDVIKRLKLAGKKGKVVANKSIEQFALIVFAKSDQIVPFDEGSLQKSKINMPIHNGVKTIGYDTPYAAKQHEDTSLRHPGPKSKSPGRGAKGQAKYLENPLKENAGKLRTTLERNMKKEMI